MSLVSTGIDYIEVITRIFSETLYLDPPIIVLLRKRIAQGGTSFVFLNGNIL